MQIIQVFEHETLRLGQQKNGFIFTQRHLESLANYNEIYENKYFTIVYQGIKFSSYVGVIQVDDLIIEILPKADKAAGNYTLWHDILLEMLIACHYVSIETVSKAKLQLNKFSILDIYFIYFMEEVNEIIRKGLIKKYRKAESNQTMLRGSIQFAKHLQHNLIHHERFYTSHQTYDVHHTLHHILKAALDTISHISVNPIIKVRIKKLLLYFPEVESTNITEATFKKIHFSRKTTHYAQAIAIAKLILLNYAPDIKGGHTDVLALLIDMNQLFEEYIFWKLKALESSFNIEVRFQESRLFWQKRPLRPDILIKTSNQKNHIIDTKWKVLTDIHPSSQDLRQIYVYNHYFESEHSLLLYPKVHNLSPVKASYQRQLFIPKINSLQDHFCEIGFVDVLDEQGRLNQNLGKEVLKMLNITAI